jgi:hypothetical protein
MAGVPYDPCYHEACDDIESVSTTAHATLAFAQTSSAVSGADKASGTAKSKVEYKGSHAKK